MKSLLLVFVSLVVLSGGAFAYDRAPTGLGGFNDWYSTWTKSDEVRFEGNYRVDYNNFVITANAKSYNDGYVNGNKAVARVEIQLTITDTNNILNPESSLPLIVRGLLANYNRYTTWSVDSHSVLFERVHGQRVFKGNLTFKTISNSGAEDVQVLNKLEVLIPGVNGVGVVSFAKYLF